MSALGHYLEEEGIATVAIALIRPQAEHTRPPRALWVPFELGRPIGPPSDPVFQKRVILTALRMLVEGGGPVRIGDFPDDDPREALDPDWHAPTNSPPSAGWGLGAPLAAAVEAELRALAPAYAASCVARERSTVGLSGLPPAECGAYLAAWLRGERPPSPVEGMSPGLALRFAIDDLKAFMLEAALTPGTRPSSRQLGDWLWDRTVLGAGLQVLRRTILAGDDERLKAVAAFFVPALRVASGG
ncbi:MAG TPA: hypothetical protein VG651_06530 [Stellaceae bacterium]|nr:hypothetical protein [Stellaceae bacterium]